MSFTRKFKINGDNKPFPTSWKMTIATLQADNSGRSPLTGIMAKTDIRNICSYDMTWEYLNEEQAYEISQIKTLDSFQITFADPSLGGDKSFKAYAGDLSLSSLFCKEDNTFVYSATMSIIDYGYKY